MGLALRQSREMGCARTYCWLVRLNRLPWGPSVVKAGYLARPVAGHCFPVFLPLEWCWGSEGRFLSERDWGEREDCERLQGRFPYAPRSRLLDGHGFDFFERGVAQEGFLHSVLQEGRHAVCNRCLYHFFRAGLCLNQTFDSVRSQQQLVERARPLKPERLQASQPFPWARRKVLSCGMPSLSQCSNP